MKTAVFISCLLFPQMVLAGEPGAAATGMLPAVLKLIAALGVVLGLLLLLYYFSRRGLPGLFPAAKSGAIKMIEVRHLMPKKALFLVEVRGRELLLGVGTERIELLTTVDWQPTETFAETIKKVEDSGART